MATDKLINQTQGADIIDALSDIATNVGNITYGPQTSADKVVSMTGYQKASTEAAISQGDTLNEAIGKLEKKADDNATAVADKIDKLTTATAGDIATVTATGEIADSAVAIETTLSDTSDAKVPTSKAVGTYVEGKGYAVGVNSSTANNLVSFNSTDGKALKDSGIAVANSSTGLADSDTAVPTSKTVKTYVDSTATGISRYLGTITAASGLSTDAKKGDFYIVKTAWTGVHVGDEIIAEKNSPAQTIDGTNWSLLHNEADTDTKYTFATGDTNGTFKVTPSDTGTAQSVSIKGLGAAAYKGVADTVSTSTDLVTSTAVNTKLASYVPNSDFVVAENNIQYLIDHGVKNICKNNTGSTTMNNVTFTANEDGSVTVKGTPSATTTYVFCALSDILEAGKDYMGYGLDSGQTSNIYFGLLGVSGVPNKRFYDSVTPFSTADISTKYTNVIIRVDGSSAINITLHPMICEKTLYDTDQSYVPYALPNHELTRLEADDRTSLAEVVDSGAKNLVEVTSSNISTTSSNVTVTVNSDKSIKITGNGSAVGGLTIVYIPVYIPAGTYVLSGCPSGANYASGYTCDLRDTNNSSRSNSDTGNGTEFTLSSGGNYRWCIRLAATYTIPSGGVTFKPMICTKAAFAISPKFVPYRPLYDDLETKPHQISITSESVLNDLPAGTVTGNLEAMVAGTAAGQWVTVRTIDLNTASGSSRRRMQVLIDTYGRVASRLYTTNAWLQWTYGHNSATKIFERTTSGNETINNISPYGSLQLVAFNNSTSGTYSTTVPKELIINGMKIAVVEAGGNVVATIQRSGQTTTYECTVTSGYSMIFYGY